MGLAQGQALRDSIRAEVARRGLALSRGRWPSLRAVVSGPLRGQGAGRELFRHFAHQAERLEGLAQAADLPLDSVLALQLALHDPFAVAGARDPLPVDWIVRESRPVVGFRSLEVTLPWLMPAYAGVNAAGLAVAVEPSPTGAAAADSPRATALAGAAVAGTSGDAPAILLVQDCLARFEHVAGAVDWCRKRPAAGELAFVFADATGMRARVVVSGRDRRVEARLEDERASATPEGRARLECVLGGAGNLGRKAVVLLEPARRRLQVDWWGQGDEKLRGAFEHVLASHVE
jgi:hypothetical protein